jgi:hypothetical protein
MAATIRRLPPASKQQAHMMVAKTNPWLDTVLATEPTRPSKAIQSPKLNESSEDAKSSDHSRLRLSAAKPRTVVKPAESSLDEAFQAAIKAIVPERLEATRRAKARVELSQGTTKDDPKVMEFTQVTSTNLTPTARKLPKSKEKPLLHTAIEHLTLDRLHTVLYKALNESPKARSVFERELLVPTFPHPGDDGETVAAQKKIGRKRPRFEMCRWCKEEFDVTSNPDDACNHHTGELELKRHARQHHNGAEDGPSDMDEKREDCPDGLIWGCCRADGDDDGCETTAHEIDDDYDSKRPKR